MSILISTFLVVSIFIIDVGLIYGGWRIILLYCMKQKKTEGECHCEKKLLARGVVSLIAVLLLLSFWLIFLILNGNLA